MFVIPPKNAEKCICPYKRVNYQKINNCRLNFFISEAEKKITITTLVTWLIYFLKNRRKQKPKNVCLELKNLNTKILAIDH